MLSDEQVDSLLRRLDELEARVNGHDSDFDRIYMELGHDDPWA